MVGLDSGRAGLASRSGHCEPRHRLHFRQLTEVLSGGGEVELVFCAIGTTQAQAIQLQDAFEVREQHLDLLPLAT